MRRYAFYLSLSTIFALFPIVILSEGQNYFYAVKEGNIHKEKNINSEIVGKYISEEFFPFSYEKDGWISLWKKDSKKGYQRIGFVLEKNGIIVTYDRLLQLAEESNRKYDRPEKIKPQDKKREDSSVPKRIKRLIANKEIRIGMTTEEIIRLCGKPIKINESVNARVKHEQWVYGSEIYLYFDNGILNSYSLSK